MARQPRDVEIVRTFWKMFARDASCPWALRVYCVNNLAVSAGMAEEFPPIPGTYKAPARTDPDTTVSKDAPTPVDAAAADAVRDVKQFVLQLGGERGNT
jgi:hypothetical protein